MPEESRQRSSQICQSCINYKVYEEMVMNLDHFQHPYQDEWMHLPRGSNSLFWTSFLHKTAFAVFCVF